MNSQKEKNIQIFWILLFCITFIAIAYACLMIYANYKRINGIKDYVEAGMLLYFVLRSKINLIK